MRSQTMLLMAALAAVSSLPAPAAGQAKAGVGKVDASARIKVTTSKPS